MVDFYVPPTFLRKHW